SWGTHLTKLDAGLAGGDAPDVIELGNSEMTKYMAAGAFKTLTQSAFPNNKTWLQGLKTSCQYNGKLYGVPYYAGARAVVYRKDQYKQAGIKGTLNTPQALTALNQVKTVFKQLSRASKTGDEANPQQSLVFAKGKVGSFIGNGWEWPYALDEKLGNPSLASVMGAYPMPSHIA